MKRLLVGIISLMLVGVANSPGAPGRVDAPRPAADPQIIERGAHHRVWERTTLIETPSGKPAPRKFSFVELATGLHYQEGGQWLESKEEIVSAPGGARASQGAHKVFFAANLNTLGAIDLTQPDGQRMRSHPLALAFFDPVKNESVVIAQLKDCVGEIVPPNQVIYRDAFAGGFRVDVRYTYTKAGLEQDIIVRERVPGVEQFGLDSTKARLEVLTEFVEAPAPEIRSLSADAERPNQALRFGSMQLLAGKAFELPDETQSPWRRSIGKEWVQVQGRNFLSEALPVRVIQSKLNALPVRLASVTAPGPVLASVSKPVTGRVLPPPPPGLVLTAPIQLAAVSERAEPGVVLDYVLAASATNFTFKGNTTYLISAVVNLAGTTRFEGGAVLKYTNSAYNTSTLTLDGPVDCQTAPYRPVVFTSIHDNTVGETLPGSTGAATRMGYIPLNIGENASNTDFRHFHFWNLNRALHVMGTGEDLVFRHSQWRNCGDVFTAYGERTIRLHNALVTQCGSFLFLPGSETIMGLVGENVTLNGIDSLVPVGEDATSDVQFYNSLIVAVADLNAGYSGTHNAEYSSASGLFQTSGAGAHYLVTGSTNRDNGTTNLNAALLADLRTMTTHPPLVYSNTTLTASTNLGPITARDTNAVDRGYHYAPLDYVFGQVTVTNATLTLLPGTVVGTFDYHTSGHSIALRGGASLIGDGRHDQPVWLARYNTVQEQANTNWTSQNYWGFVTATTDDTPLPAARLRFTHWSCLGNDRNYMHGRGNASGFHFTDNQFHGGQMDTWSPSLYFTNCVFERTGLSVNGSAEVAPINVTFRNCLFWSNSVWLYREEDVTSTWLAKDNLFFNCAQVDVDDYGLGTSDFTHAGHVGNKALGTASNVSLSAFTFATGPLGRFYLPTGSALINAGSVTNAGLGGLYHHTTITNQTKDGATHLDIGFHYVALTNGLAVDTDGDGLPDYVEDVNGNSTVDSGETDWQDDDTDRDLLPDGWEVAHGLNPLNAADGSADADGDLFSNRLEYMEGTDPFSAASFPVRPGLPGGGVQDYSTNAMAEGGYEPLVHPPGLVLWGPWVSGTNLTFTYSDGATNVAWDMFHTTNLVGNAVTNSAWQWRAQFAPGQTNLTIGQFPAGQEWFVLGSTLDSDGDGLPDGFEHFVLHTSPTNADANANGLWDGDDDANGNGRADVLDYLSRLAVIVEANQPTATEGGGTGQFTITLPADAPPGGQVVQFATGGSATAGEDYSLSAASSVTVPAGQRQATVTVTAIQDTIPAAVDRFVELAPTNAGPFAISGVSAQVRVVDNDLPLLRLMASVATAVEPTNGVGQNGQFVVWRDGPTNAALAVGLTRTGTAIQGTDVATLGTSVIIPAGALQAAVTVTPLDDALYEGEETVTLTLQTGSGYQLAAGETSATVRVMDSEPPLVELVATDSDAREQGANPGTFRLTRVGYWPTPLNVNIATEGTARPGIDYSGAPGLGYVVIPAYSNEVVFAVTPVDDAEIETQETIVLRLAAGLDYQIGSSNIATVKLDDNDAVFYAWSVNKVTAAYGIDANLQTVDVPCEITFTRTGSALAAAQHSYQIYIGGSTNINPNGYLITGDANPVSKQIIFPAGSATATIQLHNTASSASLGYVGAQLGAPSIMQGNGIDVHFVGADKVIKLEVIERIAIEGGQQARVRFSRPQISAVGAPGFGVFYTATGEGTAQVDHNLVTNNAFAWNVDVPYNVLTADLLVTAINDGTSEGWEKLFITLDPMQPQFSPDTRTNSVGRVAILLRDPSTGVPQPTYDTDNDGLSDTIEALAGQSAFIPHNPRLDADHDGLTTLQEQALGYHPTNADSNTNGIKDNIESILAAAGVTSLADYYNLWHPGFISFDLTAPFGATGPVTLQVGTNTVAQQIVPGGFFALGLERGRSYEVRVLPLSGTAVGTPYTATIASLTDGVNGIANRYTFYWDGDYNYGVGLDDPQGVLSNRLVRANQSSLVATLHLPAPRLLTDLNRDGLIATNGSDVTSAAKPFRFWLNDDNDSGETGGTDQVEPFLPDADGSGNIFPNPPPGTFAVDGVRDLVDFFPVWIDLELALKAWPTNRGFQYRLRHADNSVWCVFTNLSRTNAFAYLTNVAVAANLAAAETRQILSTGIALPGAFLNAITNGQGGVMLLEASRASTNPLVLEITKSGKLVGDAVLHIQTASITNFYRYINLRDVAGGRGGMPTRLATPSGWPDELAINKNFVFVHGYNVTRAEAVGWNSETFKRLWWSGSKAKFHGVNWRGDQSRDTLGLDEITPDYHINVLNAFATANPLRNCLSSLTGETTVAAHSLGNMVVSSAITDWDAPIKNYFMIDAAVAKEAYDGAEPTANDMVHLAWDGYTNRLRASEWHKLFSVGDGRRTLTWRNRFANQRNTTYYNFYSSGEEVLELHPHAQVPPEDASFLAFNLQQVANGEKGRYAWALQEKLKGRMSPLIFGHVGGSSYGGWGFNPGWNVRIESDFVVRPPAQAATITDVELRSRPFFLLGYQAFNQTGFNSAIYGPSGSQDADVYRDLYLAQGFPAETGPAGSSALQSFNPVGQSSRNFDLMNLKNGWPTGRLTHPFRGNRWLHSDLRDVAYLRVHLLYNTFVELGGMK